MANMNIAIEIAARDNASGVIGSVQRSLGGLGKAAGAGLAGLQNVAMLAGGAAVAGIGALGAALVSSTQAAMDAEMGQAELNAVLASTNGAAGMTAEAINALASKFQALTPFEDDVVLAGENMLLTFTNIGKDVFPMATEAMLNMGQKFGSVDAAAVQLGKALNDPIAGVSALRKVGVTLTEAQEESIKAFMAQGDIASAQKIILGELETEFGGLAVAAGDTLTGKMTILKNSLGDIQEQIGAALLPALTGVADMFLDGLNSEQGQAALAGMVTMVDALAAGIGTAAEIVSSFAGNLDEGMTPLDSFIEAIWDVAPQWLLDALVDLRDNILPAIADFFANNIQPIADWVAQNVEMQDALMAVGVVVASIVLPALAGIVAAVAPVVAVAALLVGGIALLRTAWENDWGGIQEKTQAVIDYVVPLVQTALANIQQWWADNGASIIASAQNAWNTISGAVQAVIAFVVPLVQNTLAAIQQFWQAHGETIMTVVGGLWENIKTMFSGAFAVISEIFAAFKAAFEGDWYGFGEHLRGAWDALWQMIGELLRNQLTILGAIAADLGDSIVDGIANGIRNGAGAITDAARGAAQAALDAAKGFLGIHSPSKVFETVVGANISAGIAGGITGSTGQIAGAMNNALAIPAMPSAQTTGSPGGSGGAAVRIDNLTIYASDSAGGQRAADGFVRALRAQGVTL